MLCIYSVHNELCYYLQGHGLQRINGLSIEEGLPCILGASRKVIRTSEGGCELKTERLPSVKVGSTILSKT